jgi:GNAT superfamily N-acetyltransferase
LAWRKRQWRRVLEILRWRGLFRTFLLALREICRPIAYWNIFYIIENDLKADFPRLYARRPFEVRIYAREEDLAPIVPELSAMGELTRDDFLSRAKSNVLGVAYAGAETVGYSWMTCSAGSPQTWNLFPDLAWVAYPDEAIVYGSFVREPWRGQGVHSSLDVTLNQYAREHGIVKTVGRMSVLNSQTLALAKHSGNKRRTMTVAFVRVRGINRTWATAFGAPLSSRFRRVG